MSKIKDILIPITFGISVVWLVQHFFINKNNVSTPNIENRSFTAPASQQIAEPLYLDVDFYDEKERSKDQENLTRVKTTYGELTFSNFGGILANLSYDLKNNINQPNINIIQPDNSKENGAFLIGLNGFGDTPYYYDLIEDITENTGTTDNNNGIHKLSYKAESENAIITKQFTIYKDSPKIDLDLTLEPKNVKELRARIFLPGPETNNLKEDSNKAVLYSQDNRLEKKALKEIELFGKEYPSLFGLEDHYFTTLLINDQNKFAKRAYFKISSTKRATSILESTYVKDKTTWKLSFYCGPKELNYLSKIDPRLTDLLEYGWFSFIAKPILYILHLIYSVFKSYGLSIVIITILTRLIILPFTAKSETYRRRNLEVQKKLRYIEQAYKNDPETLAREKLAILRKHGIGSGAFLPIFVQTPIFIGLSRVINNAIEFYKVPFLWIPDLSLPDPYYILPMLFAAGMALQISQTNSNAKQRLIIGLTSIVIGAFFTSFSAGLTLYLSLSTLLGVAQTYIQRRLKLS